MDTLQLLRVNLGKSCSFHGIFSTFLNGSSLNHTRFLVESWRSWWFLDDQDFSPPEIAMIDHNYCSAIIIHLHCMPIDDIWAGFGPSSPQIATFLIQGIHGCSETVAHENACKWWKCIANVNRHIRDAVTVLPVLLVWVGVRCRAKRASIGSIGEFEQFFKGNLGNFGWLHLVGKDDQEILFSLAKSAGKTYKQTDLAEETYFACNHQGHFVWDRECTSRDCRACGGMGLFKINPRCQKNCCSIIFKEATLGGK